MLFDNQCCKIWNYLYSSLNFGFLGDSLFSIKGVKEDFFKRLISLIFLIFGYSMVFIGIKMKKTNLTFFFTFCVFNSFFKIIKSIKIFLEKQHFLPVFFSHKLEFIIKKCQSKKGFFILIVLIISVSLSYIASYIINGFFYVLISLILISLYMSELTSTSMGILIFLSICFLTILLRIFILKKIENFIFAIVFAIGGSLIVFFGTSHIIRNFLVEKKKSENIFHDFSEIPIHLKISILALAAISFFVQSIYIFQNKKKH